MTRWTWGLGHANLLGALAATALAMLVAVAVWRRAPAPPWARLLWICSTAAALAGCAGAISRGGWLAAGAGLLMAGCWPGAVARRWLAWTVLAVLAVLVLVWPRGGERAAAGFAASGDPSIATRLCAWRVGAGIVADRPWSGASDLGLMPAMALLSPGPAHLAGGGWPVADLLCDPLDCAARHGLPVLALATGLLAWPLLLGLAAARRGSAAGAALAAGLAAWLAAGCTSCISGMLPWASGILVLLWLALAWRVIADRLEPAPRPGRCGLAAAALAVLLPALLWGAAQVWRRTADGAPPRLLVADGGGAPVAGLGPARGPVRGAWCWLLDIDRQAAGTVRQVQRRLAGDGWEAWAAPAVPVGLRELPVLVASEARIPDALAAAGGAGALVLCDCPPALLPQVRACPQPVLLLQGGLDARGRDLAEAGLGAAGLRVLPLGRLWPERMPQLLPTITAWLAGLPGTP